MQHEDERILNSDFFFPPAPKKIQESRNIWLSIPYGLSTTFAAVTFREIQHKPNFAEVGTEYTCDQVHMCTQRRPTDMHNPAL